MRRAMIFAVTAIAIMGGSLMTFADGEDRYQGRERIVIDHEALKDMSWEERREYMRAYKAARAAEAERAGVTPGAGGPLATPRQVEDAHLKDVRIPGTSIQYDSGTVTGTAGLASQMLGNRFDTALNTAGTACCWPVETSGSITMVTFDMVATFFSSAVFSIYSNVMGTTAQQVTSMGIPAMTGLNVHTLNAATTANAYANGSFLAGIWQFSAGSTDLGIDTGSTGGQGFHAISLNDGATGSLLTTVTTGGMGANAVFRVSGNVATPVELMNFTIDD